MRDDTWQQTAIDTDWLHVQRVHESGSNDYRADSDTAHLIRLRGRHSVIARVDQALNTSPMRHFCQPAPTKPNRAKNTGTKMAGHTLTDQLAYFSFSLSDLLKRLLIAGTLMSTEWALRFYMNVNIFSGSVQTRETPKRAGKAITRWRKKWRNGEWKLCL
ncbi:hypothetical protein BaRGS_00029106 [Batillaria attramentaria]|uniref:Uncharacterized protein n=1 Tax=Batillaria attramentaria TaxID=370345 RepID=A0ABD0JY58_9CAEN